jgi:hypothetical protein
VRRNDAQLGLALDDPPKRRREGVLLSFYPQGQPIPVAEVLEREAAAAGQERLILELFRTVAADRRLTPSEVAQAFPVWPLTSVRARITTLTTKGLLDHHARDRRPGPFGAKESCWSLAGPRS